jgi:hypothetical protein
MQSTGCHVRDASSTMTLEHRPHRTGYLHEQKEDATLAHNKTRRDLRFIVEFTPNELRKAAISQAPVPLVRFGI